MCMVITYSLHLAVEPDLCCVSHHSAYSVHHFSRIVGVLFYSSLELV